MIEVIESILNVMIENNFESVAIPGISTGIFGYPLKGAALIICKTIKSFIDENELQMKGKQIVFCNFDDITTNAFLEATITRFEPDLEEPHSPNAKKRCDE